MSLRKAFKYNAIEFRILLDEMFGMTQAEMKKHIAKKDLTLIELATAKQMMNAIAGDIKAFDFALDRSIGKVKEKVEVQGPRPTVIKRKNGDIIELGASLTLDKETTNADE
jgi:hypothetical protein